MTSYRLLAVSIIEIGTLASSESLPMTDRDREVELNDRKSRAPSIERVIVWRRNRLAANQVSLQRLAISDFFSRFRRVRLRCPKIEY